MKDDGGGGGKIEKGLTGFYVLRGPKMIWHVVDLFAAEFWEDLNCRANYCRAVYCRGVAFAAQSTPEATVGYRIACHIFD